MEKPWDNEPDRLDWVSEGITCAIRRMTELGHLCGYIAVLPGHPWHGGQYSMIDAYPHGGLTFACREADTRDLKTGNEDAWWIGFDCAHSGDLVPYTDMRWGFSSEVYRDMGYVRREVEGLAQLAAQLAAEKNYTLSPSLGAPEDGLSPCLGG